MTKEEVIKELLKQNEKSKQQLYTASVWNKNEEDIRKSIESTNQTIAEIAKTLEK